VGNIIFPLFWELTLTMMIQQDADDIKVLSFSVLHLCCMHEEMDMSTFY